MFYYLGTVQHNCGDLETAVASYMRAKEYSLHSDNLTFKGIISSTISDVYLQNHNYPEAVYRMDITTGSGRSYYAVFSAGMEDED